MEIEKTLRKNSHFIQSGNWWIEGDEIWFMNLTMNILLYMNKNEKKVIYVSTIPLDRFHSGGRYSRCVKSGNFIVCLPDYEGDIWRYHLSDGLWTRIHLRNPKGISLSCSNVWLIQDKLYVIFRGLKQIIELDICAGSIENYYNVSVDAEQRISSSILVDNCIYIAGSYPAAIYKFNYLDKELQTYLLPGINDQIHTICFDGEKFWLSGRCRKIYIWKEDSEEIIFLDNFPDDFGIYNFSGKYKQLLNCKEDSMDMPLFLYSVFDGRYVWLIPAQTNKILYINKETYEIKEFSIANELQTEEEVKTQLLGHKYLIEYVKDNRYIGLYSLKNKWVLEIDFRKMKYKVLDYEVGADAAEHIMSAYHRNKFLINEQEILDLNIFIKYLLSKSRNFLRREGKLEEDVFDNLCMKKNIGKKIYFSIRN